MPFGISSKRKSYSSPVASEYWQARIATLQALVAAYDAALLAFATTGVQQYTVDTGQTKQTVMRAEIASLQGVRNRLLSELDDMGARCGDGSVSYVSPDF